MSAGERLLLVEGFHDRAFWAGALERLGCRDLSEGGRVKDVRDPRGTKVAGGMFGFRSRSGAFVRIRPCHGEPNVTKETKASIEDRTTKSIELVVACFDSDAHVADTANAIAARRQWAGQVAQACDASATFADDAWNLDEGATRLALVVWSAGDADDDELPATETLERLVCAAIRAAYPERARTVFEWLNGLPAGAPAPTPKAFAWSHMAGWYAERGCDDFYQAIWRDERIAAELEARLERNGAWRVAKMIAV